MGSIVVERGIRRIGSSHMWHNARETSGEPPVCGSSWSYQSPVLPSAGACNSIGRYAFLHYCIETLSLSLASITRLGLRIERDEIAFQSFLPSSSFSVICARSCYICSYNFSAVDFPRNLLPSTERGLLSLPKNLVQKFLCWNMCFFLASKRSHLPQGDDVHEIHNLW